MDQENFWQQFPHVCSRVSTRQVDSDKVVLNPKSGNFVTLNEVATYLWDTIDGRSNMQAILEKLVREYAVDEQTAREDLSEIVAELLEENAIELRNQPGEQI